MAGPVPPLGLVDLGLQEQPDFGRKIWRFSEQRQLFAGYQRFPFISKIRVATFASLHRVFLTEMCYELGDTFAVGGRQKRPVSIALPIILDQMGEVLLEKRKENGG